MTSSPCLPGPNGFLASSTTIASVPGVGIPIESAPEFGSTGIGPSAGARWRRSGQLRHAVGAADRASEALREGVDDGRRDRRSAGIETVEAGEMGGRRLRSVHERNERRDRADDERRPMFEKGFEHEGGLEPVGQDDRGLRREGAHHLNLETGDMEQRRDAKDTRMRPESEKRGADRRVMDEVAMSQHRAFRHARRSRRIEQKRDVVGGDLHGAAAASRERPETR